MVDIKEPFSDGHDVVTEGYFLWVVQIATTKSCICSSGQVLVTKE